ncbi:MAG: hypothetical protein Kow0068_04310 [Marinilabiliales bacterium]
MTFGKNRVQYGDYVWQFYRFKKFDVYFHEGGNELAQYTAKYAQKTLEKYEQFFEYSLDKRIIILVFNNLSDFRQSNIGLTTEDDQYNIGGTTKIIDNKVFIYFEGDHNKFDKQISAAIAEVLINEYLIGNDLKSRVANSTLIALPEWYINGLISYLSNEWDYEIDNIVKDGILSKRYQNFSKLTGEDAVYAGHSIWNYIAKRYGKKVIPNILYLTRVTKNTDSGFLYVLGTSLKYLSYDWLNYYDQMYYKQESLREQPDENNRVIKTKPQLKYGQIKISPDGNYLAYTTNKLGRYKIWIKDLNTGKKKKIIRREHQLDQITDYSYPVLGWHPSGTILAWFTEEKGSVYLYFYDLQTSKKEKREIVHFSKVLSFDYSDDGFKMIVSAVTNGQSDLYFYNIPANSATKVSFDLADDLAPILTNKSTSIAFSSNRAKDTLVFDNKFPCNVLDTRDIFEIDVNENQNTIKQITKTENITEDQVFKVSDNKYIFLSDKNGIFNRMIANYDSTISFVDTAIHYKFFTVVHPLSNYYRNIQEHNLNTKVNKYAELIYANNKDNIYIGEIDTTINNFKGIYKNTKYRNEVDKLYQEKLKEINDSLNVKDSIAEILHKLDSLNNDTNVIDVNKYVFEIEKRNYYKAKSDTNIESNDSLPYPVFQLPKQRYYFTAFYTNYMVNQIDFNFLNETYQTYTGGQVYFNPNLSLLFKIGTQDLMEDYRITGGFRIAGNFDSNEYLLSFENLKTRWDKQIIFHRMSFINKSTYDIVKTNTHEVHYILKYPFNQVARFDLTTSFRHDREVYKSIESIQDLQKDNVVMAWLGLKTEYVFDNTRKLGVNIYNGIRYKVFAEGYYQVNADHSNLFVVGADFRFYQKIHRNLIFASRIAGSNSFGNSLLIYYLGSVDNWINLSTRVEKFDKSVNVNQDKNWTYQTLATNMRGFTQNIRNGNSFALLNNEIRWPFVRYFANRPINSDFLNNLQFVGFFDVGSAWTGLIPDKDKNAYNNTQYYSSNGPVEVIIDNDKSLFVYGFGGGLRSRILGYFVRADWAWGVDSGVLLPKIFYLSLSLDF